MRMIEMLFSVIRRKPELESETSTERSQVKCMKVRETTNHGRPEKEIFMPS